jgi:hypothetical protein
MALLELKPVDIWNTDLDKFVSEWEVRPWSSRTDLSVDSARRTTAATGS